MACHNPYFATQQANATSETSGMKIIGPQFNNKSIVESITPKAVILGPPTPESNRFCFFRHLEVRRASPLEAGWKKHGILCTAQLSGNGRRQRLREREFMAGECLITLMLLCESAMGYAVLPLPRRWARCASNVRFGFSCAISARAKSWMYRRFRIPQLLRERGNTA